jgi:hypothetical protein
MIEDCDGEFSGRSHAADDAPEHEVDLAVIRRSTASRVVREMRRDARGRTVTR